MVFLAGVGNAEILKNGELFATAKTLTDSSITIGVSAEDIRAGQGAKLYGKYFHTSTFDLKMTDAMFKMEYIAANVGAELEWGGDVFKDEEVVVASGGKLKVDGTPVPFTSGGKVYIYAKLVNDEHYKTYEYTSEGVTVAEGTYCVKYLYTNDNARKLVVKANFTPDTLSVLLTSNLYAGDDKNPATGTKIGTVTIKVPRFLLSGSQELSMNMTGASTTPFEGSALASNAKGCDGEGIYAEIIEIIEGRKWYDAIDRLEVDGGEEELLFSENPAVYAVFNDGGTKLLNSNQYTRVYTNETGAESQDELNDLIGSNLHGELTSIIYLNDNSFINIGKSSYYEGNSLYEYELNMGVGSFSGYADFRQMSYNGSGFYRNWVTDVLPYGCKTLCFAPTRSDVNENNIVSGNEKLNNNVETVILMTNKEVKLNDAFVGWTNLKEVYLGECTTVYHNQFAGCFNLEVVYGNIMDIQDGVQFLNCKKLHTVDISHSTKLGSAMFAQCVNLSTIKLNSAITTIPTAAFTGTNIQSIVIPENVKNIEQSAFSQSALKNVILPEGLKNIGLWSFGNTQLKTITIPSSVTTIQSQAFQDTPLHTITINKPVDSIVGSPWGAENATVNWIG